MAIALNKLIRRCLKAAAAQGKINDFSTSRIFLYDVSRDWRRQLDATKYKSSELPDYTQKQVAGIDVIISQLMCLEMDGCDNVEQLFLARIRQLYGIK